MYIYVLKYICILGFVIDLKGCHQLAQSSRMNMEVILLLPMLKHEIHAKIYTICTYMYISLGCRVSFVLRCLTFNDEQILMLLKVKIQQL